MLLDIILLREASNISRVFIDIFDMFVSLSNQIMYDHVMMQYKDKMCYTNTILYKINKYVGQIMITAWNSWQDRVPKPSRRDL